VARILADEQRAQGYDSRLLSVISGDLRSNPLSAPLHTLAAGIDEYVVKRPAFSSPISFLRDKVNGIDVQTLEGSDVLHLHGVNGTLQFERLSAVLRNTRIIWTLHDMNPFTGVCHYSLGCNEFTNLCSSCPAVKPTFHNSVSNLLASKKRAIANAPGLKVVSPSRWLAKEVERSVVFRAQSTHVIPNPIDPIFLGENHAKKPGPVGEAVRIIVVAKNLSDPVKQVDVAVKAFRSAGPRLTDATLTLVGAGGREFAGDGIILTGPLSKLELSQAYSRSDVLIVPSKAENSPLVIGEAAANGCIPLVASVGGMAEMVAALGHGKEFGTEQELADQLIDLNRLNVTVRQKMQISVRVQARVLYSPSTAVNEYAKVYSGLLPE